MRETADLTRRVSPPFSSAVCQLRDADEVGVNLATPKEPETLFLAPLSAPCAAVSAHARSNAERPPSQTLSPHFPKLLLFFSARARNS